MQITTGPSISILGCLCQEADRLRWRMHLLQETIHRCQNRGLFTRLVQELRQLQSRREELNRMVASLRNDLGDDSLGTQLLAELVSRPVSL